MQIRCRNCGAIRAIPKYHGSMLVTCPDCEWQEMLPPRRHLPKELDHRAGDAFAARAQRQAAVRALLDEVSPLSQHRFEQFCASLFSSRGHEVALADQMFDESHALELRSGSDSVFVACRPVEHRVTVDDLERLAGAMRHGSAAGGICVTNGDLDDACQAFATDAKIELIDLDRLVELLTDVPIEQLREWIDPAEVTPAE
ncbi:MAG: restriction endonuclease [Planctomycetes bacterium]|nr:restriction endonuclease [Planctomycetota bacterium]